MKTIISLITLSLCFISAAQPDFIMEDWKEAVKRAKKENKPLVVDFYTDWCGWCKVMDKRTFADAEVTKRMDAEFICLKIDAEKGMGIELAFKYRVSSFPTYAFFTPDGKLIMKSAGYMPIEDWMSEMDQALAKSAEEDVISGVTTGLPKQYPDFLKEYIAGTKKSRPSRDEIEGYLDETGDLTSEMAFSLMCASGVPAKYQDKVLASLPDLRKLYGSMDVNRLTDRILMPLMVRAQKEKDRALADSCVVFMRKYMEDFSAESELVFYARFYQASEDWANLKDAVEGLINQYSAGEGLVNGFAWAVYEKCEDEKMVTAAIEWMKAVVSDDSKYYVLDTYAALLFKVGAFEDARDQMLRAIEKGTEEGQNVDGSKKILSEIERELANE